ncbi:hypothetical protein NKH18_44190 [Streptomyces sp. M10(2022)]
MAQGTGGTGCRGPGPRLGGQPPGGVAAAQPALRPGGQGRARRGDALRRRPVARRAPLVALGDGRAWQDDRGRLYLLREPGTGHARSADELLTTGTRMPRSPGTPRSCVRGPPDPHALAGWLLAHTQLHPERRRLLARPERFAALLEEGRPERWAEVAGWLAVTPSAGGRPAAAPVVP